MAKNRPDNMASLASMAPTDAPEEFGPGSLTDFANDADVVAQRQKIAELEKELEAMRAEKARMEAAAQPLSEDSGPGVYEIVVRHAPTKLKRFKTEAASEKDAWAKWIQEAAKANTNIKDPARTSLRQFEQYLARGRVEGFDRNIVKVVPQASA
jgi:hypothetical protein